MEALRRFYDGRRVLVTGHTGFKGTWLATWLEALGAEVYGFALPPDTAPSLFEDSATGPRLAASQMGDVRDLRELQSFMAFARPSVVFHLAAQALVRRSYDEPVETFATNVLGTVHCLESARLQEGLQTTIIVTSDKCYEPPSPPGGYAETAPMGGDDPYSASKGAAELIVSSYRQSFFSGTGRAVASARAGNVVGGGDWSSDRLIPDIVRASLRGEAVDIRRPSATRPWQHVLDALYGYLLLAKAATEQPERYARGWNFGPPASTSITVREVTNQMLLAMGTGRATFAETDVGPHEAVALDLDSTAARAELDWTPRLSLRESIDWTARWYAAWAAATDSAHELMKAQILEYSEVGP